MQSLRSRITLMTVLMIVVSASIITLLSVLFIQRSKRTESNQMLLLLCETGQRNLDFYFDSVQKSVEKVSSFAEYDLKGLETEELSEHIERVADFFEKTAYKTNGVLTYYYRIDPEVSDSVKGFWYTNNGDNFIEHEVTDITLYDTSDTSKLVWFTVPKYKGEPVWLPPYITDNLDVRVISYNVPIYWKTQFVGVIGIEIDYSTMAEQVDSIRLYNNGYAFLCDEAGNIFFHPRIDTAMLTDAASINIPEGINSSSTFFRYTYEGIKKQAAWLPLCNGMRLTVSAPVTETEGDWQKLIREILIVSVIVLIAMSLITMSNMGHITKPLEELIRAAEQVDKGNYDTILTYDNNDEVGRLTKTFNSLTNHMKVHISDLNKRVYVDALTSVKNKGAFSDAINKLQSKIDNDKQNTAFAIGMFDCDDLKSVNDNFGHENGDIYLKGSCRLICQVYQHSPVFRIGGDEFAVILQNADYQNRENLLSKLKDEQTRISASAVNKWEEIHLSHGFSVFDPLTDNNVSDVVRRADKNMYTNKHSRKESHQ